MENQEQKQQRMAVALEQAMLAFDDGEVPVGAAIFRAGELVSIGRNRREKGKNALLHAEIEAIGNACRALGGWRLEGCELYVTLEPCPMCAGAIINARLDAVVFGAHDLKAGACGSVADLFAFPFNHHPAVTGGVMDSECSMILKVFFARLRDRRKKQTDG